MKTEEKIISIIVEQLGLTPEEVTPEKSFVEDLSADSLDLTELIMTIEEKFNVEVPQDQAEKLRTVNDLIQFVLLLEQGVNKADTTTKECIEQK